MKNCSAESGTCNRCVNACKTKPGWFAPGEVEKVAEYLDISLAELFKTKLGVDWWEADDFIDHDVFLLAPATVGYEGQMYPGNPHGRCVFLGLDDRCQIHPVKPKECRETWCGEDPTVNIERRQQIVLDWDSRQKQIKKLLGCRPMPDPTPYTEFDLFGF